MQSSAPDRSHSWVVTIDYSLLAALNSPNEGSEDESIAVCIVRLVRSNASCEEHPLAAWHFLPTGSRVAMPIEETGASTEEIYVGRFLLLPRRDLLLALVDARGEEQFFVWLCLVPTKSPCSEGEGGGASWRVLVVWSDGPEIALHRRGGPSLSTSSAGALSLSDAQCCAFVRLGGLLHTEDHGDRSFAARRTTHNLTWVGDESRKPGFALHTSIEPDDGEIVSLCSTSRSFRVLIERGRINLSHCRLQLPVVCQGCLHPVVGEISFVETLWGKMHPSCTVASQNLPSESSECAHAPNPKPRTNANFSQLALPGVAD
jgi:hypothetical protein